MTILDPKTGLTVTIPPRDQPGPRRLRSTGA